MTSPKVIPETEQATTSLEAEIQPVGDGGAAHLEAFHIPDIDEDTDDPDGFIDLDENGEALPPAPVQIDKEAFYVVFCTAFDAPGMLMAKFKPVGIQPDERQTSRAASDAIYGLLEIYYPKALMPQSEVLAHLMVAGPFVIGKVMIVREIFRADRAKSVEEAKAAPEETSPPQFTSARSMSDWDREGET